MGVCAWLHCGVPVGLGYIDINERAGATREVSGSKWQEMLQLRGDAACDATPAGQMRGGAAAGSEVAQEGAARHGTVKPFGVGERVEQQPKSSLGFVTPP